MLRKFPITVVALAALLAVSAAHAQTGTTSGTASATMSQPGKAPVKASATKTAMSSKKHWAKVDLNAASKEDLMKLPGVGDATADKIIAARPFKTKGELLSKSIVTKKEYSAIAMRVIAKQEPTANAATK